MWLLLLTKTVNIIIMIKCKEKTRYLDNNLSFKLSNSGSIPLSTYMLLPKSLPSVYIFKPYCTI